MKAPTEAQLASYISAYLERHPDLNRTINRHFQGTITNVSSLNAGTFLVQIDRTEGPDQNTYVSAVPGYVPQVGDLVELEWRDNNVAYVKYPLISSASVPAKLDIQTANGVASFTLTVPSAMIGRFTNLKIHITSRASGASSELQLRANGDSGTNYESSIFNHNNAALAAGAPSLARTQARVGVLLPSTAPAGAVSHSVIEIANADSTSQRKPISFHLTRWDADTAAGSVSEWGHGQWSNTTDPISDITFLSSTGNFVNSRAILWGE